MFKREGAKRKNGKRRVSTSEKINPKTHPQLRKERRVGDLAFTIGKKYTCRDNGFAVQRGETTARGEIVERFRKMN